MLQEGKTQQENIQRITSVTMDEEVIEPIRAATHFLTRSQDEYGSWEGGKIRRFNVDVFATSEALIALHRASQFVE
jgi:hypothetical protein